MERDAWAAGGEKSRHAAILWKRARKRSMDSRYAFCLAPLSSLPEHEVKELIQTSAPLNKVCENKGTPGLALASCATFAKHGRNADGSRGSLVGVAALIWDVRGKSLRGSIIGLGVHDDHRKKGIATALVRLLFAGAFEVAQGLLPCTTGTGFRWQGLHTELKQRGLLPCPSGDCTACTQMSLNIGEGACRRTELGLRILATAGLSMEKGGKKIEHKEITGTNSDVVQPVSLERNLAEPWLSALAPDRDGSQFLPAGPLVTINGAGESVPVFPQELGGSRFAPRLAA